MGTIEKRLVAGLAAVGLVVGAAAFGDALHARSNDAATSKVSEPVAGLSCGWEAQPCQLEAIVVRARA